MALARLSWTELAALHDQIELVLIPIGSTEQHGPHLGLGEDHLITEAFCELAAQRMYPRLLSLPAVPWGISDHHMNFAGSMTLRAETFLALLEDLIESMRHHGFRRFLIVNGHGGNLALMAAAVQDLGFRLDIDFLGSLSHYRLAPDETAGEIDIELCPTHACEVEASYSYYLRPDLVREEALAPGALDAAFQRLHDQFAEYSLEWPVAIDALTRNGALGDARQGSREAGRRIVEAAVHDLADMIEFLRTSGQRWNGPPHRQVHIPPPLRSV